MVDNRIIYVMGYVNALNTVMLVHSIYCCYSKAVTAAQQRHDYSLQVWETPVDRAHDISQGCYILKHGIPVYPTYKSFSNTPKNRTCSTSKLSSFYASFSEEVWQNFNFYPKYVICLSTTVPKGVKLDSLVDYVVMH